MSLKLLRHLRERFERAIQPMESQVNRTLNKEKTTKSIREQCVIVVIMALVLGAVSVYLFLFHGMLLVISISLPFSMLIVGVYGLITGKMPFS